MTQEKYRGLSAEDAAVIHELSATIDIADAERLTKGCEWKFRIENSHGEYALLRINDIEFYEWIKNDAEMYRYVYDAGINVMRFIDMGITSDGKLSYQLYSWFDGVDLSEALPRMSRDERYSAGIKCGELMRRLHQLPPMKEAEPWSIRFARNVNEAIADNEGDPEIAELTARYLRESQALLENRPQSFTHGDWNPQNLMLCGDGRIGIIDLSGENDVADPWWEFWLTPSDSSEHIDFYAGQLIGYFGSEPPEEFFALLPLYLAYFELKYPHDPSAKIGESVIAEAVKRLRSAVASHRG